MAACSSSDYKGKGKRASCPRKVERKCSESAEKIWQKYSPATVSIMSETILTTNGGSDGPPAEGVRQTYKMTGNGFFIRAKSGKHCPRRLIVCPSALVLVPPSVLANNNRYPYTNSTVPVPTGVMPNTLTQVSQVLVTVHKVKIEEKDDCKKKCSKPVSIVYNAKVILIDGAGGVAVLEIDPESKWNQDLPCIPECHPYFRLGRSRDACKGETVYALGSHIGNILAAVNPVYQDITSHGVYEGTLSDNRWVDASGYSLPEMLLVDMNIYDPSIGLPIINQSGEVIGMQVLATTGGVPFISYPGTGPLLEPAFGVGGVGAITEFFMRPVILASFCHKKKKYKKHLESVPDALSSYFRYKKGYAGIAYRLSQPADLNMYTKDLTTGLRDTLLESDGTVYQGPSSMNAKVSGGAIIKTTAGNATVVWSFVPGAASDQVTPYGSVTSPAGTQDSPFLATLLHDYLWVSICGCPIGDNSRQIAPALATWQTVPGETITIELRRADQTTGTVGADNYETLSSAAGTLQDYPAVMDYPWVVLGTFPLITAGPGPATLANPQFPQANFVPAL